MATRSREPEDGNEYSLQLLRCQELIFELSRRDLKVFEGSEVAEDAVGDRLLWTRLTSGGAP